MGFEPKKFIKALLDATVGYDVDAHEGRHADGGADAIDAGDLVAGADPRSSSHKARHASGGDDAIAAGELVEGADPRSSTHASRHDPSGADPLGGAAGEGHITLLPCGYWAIGQGTWAYSLTASQFMYGFFINNPAADLDNLSWRAYMAAGTYTVTLLTRTGPTMGIAKILIDGVEVASWDLYTAGIVYNVQKRQIGITLALSALRTITYKVDGQNASSTGYRIDFTHISLYRAV